MGIYLKIVILKILLQKLNFNFMQFKLTFPIFLCVL